MLTSKQRDLLIFIHERLEKDGVSPSFDEMKDALGLKSKSGVHRLITALEERGFLRRLAHRARAHLRYSAYLMTMPQKILNLSAIGVLRRFNVTHWMQCARTLTCCRLAFKVHWVA